MPGRNGRKGRHTQLVARRFPSSQRSGTYSQAAGANSGTQSSAISPGHSPVGRNSPSDFSFSTAAAAGGGAGGMGGVGPLVPPPPFLVSSAGGGGGFVTLRKSPTGATDASDGFSPLLRRGSLDTGLAASTAAATSQPAAAAAAGPAKGSGGSGGYGLRTRLRSMDSVSEMSTSSPAATSLIGYPLLRHGSTMSQTFGSPMNPGSGLPSTGEQRVSVFYPRQSSVGEGEISLHDRPNEDRMQVRVEGYFDSDAGVLVPNDLPKSTLLYVLTASDGRDLMFKTTQYSLQLLICVLKTPSLFSPESAPLLEMWALRLWKNYNTIRHGRSLFKMGRGILNLFTLQTVCERMWMRYGEGVKEGCAPLLAVIAFLLEPLREVGVALGLQSLRRRRRGFRLKRFPGEAETQPRSSDITPDDSKATSPVGETGGDDDGDGQVTSNGGSGGGGTYFGLLSFLFPSSPTNSQASGGGHRRRSVGNNSSSNNNNSGSGSGRYPSAKKDDRKSGGQRPSTTSSVNTGGIGTSNAHALRRGADTLVTDDTFVHVSRVEKPPGFVLSPTQRVPTASGSPTKLQAGGGAPGHKGQSQRQQQQQAHNGNLLSSASPTAAAAPATMSFGAAAGGGAGTGRHPGAGPSAQGTAAAAAAGAAAAAMPFYVKGDFGMGSFTGNRSPVNGSFSGRYGGTQSPPPPPAPPSADNLTSSFASPTADDLTPAAPGEAAKRRKGSTYTGSTYDLRSQIQRQIEEQQRHAQRRQSGDAARGNAPGEEALQTVAIADGSKLNHDNSRGGAAAADDGNGQQQDTHETNSTLGNSHHFFPPTPIMGKKTTGHTAPPSPSFNLLDGRKRASAMEDDSNDAGNAFPGAQSHPGHGASDGSNLFAPLPDGDDDVQPHRRQQQQRSSSSLGDDQGPPTLPGTLPHGHLNTLTHPFPAFSKHVDDKASHDSHLSLLGETALASGAQRNASGGSGGSLLHPIRGSDGGGGSSSCPESKGPVYLSAGPKSAAARAQEQDFFGRNSASTDSSVADTALEVAATAATTTGKPPTTPPLSKQKSPTPVAVVSPSLPAQGGPDVTSTPLSSDLLSAPLRSSNVFPASPAANLHASGSGSVEYFTNAKSMPFEEHLGERLRKQDGSSGGEKRRGKLLSRSRNFSASERDADPGASSLRRSQRPGRSNAGSMSSSQIGTRQGSAMVAATRPVDSLGSSLNPEPVALWGGIGSPNTDDDEAQRRRADGPPPDAGEAATEAKPAYGGEEENEEDIRPVAPAPPPRHEYDDSDVSLDTSSDGDEDGEERQRSDGAFPYWNDEQEPASAAAPFRWRKGPMDFDPVLMTLVGVRNLAAAIRRFLRDLTMLSSERFFILDFVERNRPSLHRRINYLWLIVSVIDLSLNTIRLAKPGWGAYAMARQNTLCRCGCRARDDPDDLVWRTNGLIARQKRDLFFPALDLDYGAPYTSNTAYLEAADPIHMQPACSRCGCLYKEVTNYTNVYQPEREKPRWLQLYDAEVSKNASFQRHTQRQRDQHIQRVRSGNPYLAEDSQSGGGSGIQHKDGVRGAARHGNTGGSGSGGRGGTRSDEVALDDDLEIVPVTVEATIIPSTLTVERRAVRFDERRHDDSGDAHPHYLVPASAENTTGGHTTSGATGSLSYVRSSLAPATAQHRADGDATSGNPHGGNNNSITNNRSGMDRGSGALLPPAKRATDDPESSVGFLLLPLLMRKLFNYVWLLRVHPNLTSMLLLQLRYLAELFLAYKYCFGNYEPNRTDAPLYQVLNPGGAVAGIVSAAVGLLRVIESAPK